MLELTTADIEQLSDEDARTLVGLLCEAELERMGQPTVLANWGGHHNAADGGVDVRIRIPVYANCGGFPRHHCIYQVKRSDLSSRKIQKEMRPFGKLRPAIHELASLNGAYILVCSGKSLTDPTLRKRIAAMQDSLGESREHVWTDYYDASRLAGWVRKFPALVAWVQTHIGRPINGWFPYANWSSTKVDRHVAYLSDALRRVRLPESKDTLATVDEALASIRQRLSVPGTAVRLVGVSGTGKTRLIETLFDSSIGIDALPQNLALYTNLNDSPVPAPVNMASDLINSGRRQVLIVDNCGLVLHNRLAEVCKAGPVSLLTVEYDIQDEPSEGTHVYRLFSASQPVIEQILKARFPNLSNINAQTITRLSGGNARVAIVLASVVREGELVTQIDQDELFDRLFDQKRPHSSATLRKTARALSLVFSFQAEDSSREEPELPRLASLAGVSLQDTWSDLIELADRDLLQARGIWRALLPHAIANRLASDALRFTLPATLNQFLSDATPRLLLSFAHRLTFLSGNPDARKLVTAWLKPDGFLGRVEELNHDEKKILRHIAPIAQEETLAAIRRAEHRAAAQNRIVPGEYLRRLVLSIAYSTELFESAFALLIDLIEPEPPGPYSNQVRRSFAHLFQLVLSGTQATLEQRLTAARDLLLAEKPIRKEFGFEALEAMLQTIPFYGAAEEDFGGEYRDHGWQPENWDDQRRWYQAALDLCEELDSGGGENRVKVREIVAKQLRGLWEHSGLEDEIVVFCERLAARAFWPEGWAAVSSILRFRKEPLPPEKLDKLERLKRKLTPRTIEEQVRTMVIAGRRTGFWDDYGVLDENQQWEKTQRELIALGQQLAHNPEMLDLMLPEIVRADNAMMVGPFVAGLVEETSNRHELWIRARCVFAQYRPERATLMFFRAFLVRLRELDSELMERILDDAVEDDVFAASFPLLQASVGLSGKGLGRLQTSLTAGRSEAHHYTALSFSNPAHGDTELAAILPSIAGLPNGFDAALDLLSMRVARPPNTPLSEDLLEQCRQLILQYDFSDLNRRDLHEFEQVSKACLVGDAGGRVVRSLLERVMSVEPYWELPFDTPRLVGVLLECQPLVGLETIFEGHHNGNSGKFARTLRDDEMFHSPVSRIPVAVLIDWCNKNPHLRFPLIAERINPFHLDRSSNKRSWRPSALELLNKAPEPSNVLHHYFKHLRPSGWVGSESAAWEANVKLLDELHNHPNADIVAVARQEQQRVRLGIAKILEQELEQERAHHERFE